MRIQSRTTLPDRKREGTCLSENAPNQTEPIRPIVEIAQMYRGTRQMGVGSGSSRKVVLQILNHIGLADFFDCIVGSEDTLRHKPEPDVFLEVARRDQCPTRRMFSSSERGFGYRGRAASWHGLFESRLRTNRDRYASCFSPRLLTWRPGLDNFR